MNPVRTQVLFKPFPSEEYTLSGFFVPETAREINNKGTIVKVGAGTKGKPMKLKEGMTVYRVLNWGQEVIIDGQLHFLMDQNAILAAE